MDEAISPQWKITAQAENALIGCILVDARNTLRLIRGIMNASDFRSDVCRNIFTAASNLINAEKPCDPVQIQAEAERLGTPADADFCQEAMLMPVPIGNAAATAQIIHDAAAARAAREIGNGLLTDELTPLEALGRLQELLSEQGNTTHTPMDAANSVMDYIISASEGKTKPFIPTGYQKLDEQLAGGLVQSGMIILAARPGTGKTTAALNIADRVAAAGGTVLYISLEMDERQLWVRRAAALSGLSYSAIYAGRLNKENGDWPRLTDAFDNLSKRSFIIRDRPASIEDIEKEARCTDGLTLLVVDHIGLIRPTPGRKSFSRYEFMTDTAHRLKQLALSLHIPILALCQLNRTSEQRESKRPSMADLRDSGALEEDADAVCLLFREAMYWQDENKPKPWESQYIDFIIDKNRHGVTGTVTLDFYGFNARIV